MTARCKTEDRLTLRSCFVLYDLIPEAECGASGYDAFNVGDLFSPVLFTTVGAVDGLAVLSGKRCAGSMLDVFRAGGLLFSDDLCRNTCDPNPAKKTTTDA